jgi:hypothetical protein
MNRWVLWAIGTVSCLALCIGIASWLLERSTRRAETDNGAIRDFHDVTAEKLDRDVRRNLPLGSTRAFVEEFLGKEGMRFSFDASSQTIQANAPYVKGSNFVVRESLGFTFQLDDASKLKSIDSKVHLTGL